MVEQIHCCGTKNWMKGLLVFGNLDILSHVGEGPFLEGKAVVIREGPFGGCRRLADSGPLEVIVPLDSSECSRDEYGSFRSHSVSILAARKICQWRKTYFGRLPSMIQVSQETMC